MIRIPTTTPAAKPTTVETSIRPEGLPHQSSNPPGYPQTLVPRKFMLQAAGSLSTNQDQREYLPDQRDQLVCNVVSLFCGRRSTRMTDTRAGCLRSDTENLQFIWMMLVSGFHCGGPPYTYAFSLISWCVTNVLPLGQDWSTEKRIKKAARWQILIVTRLSDRPE
jgi:hypothetical protein